MGRHSADFGDLEATADSSSAPKSPKNYESPTAILRIVLLQNELHSKIHLRGLESIIASSIEYKRIGFLLLLYARVCVAIPALPIQIPDFLDIWRDEVGAVDPDSGSCEIAL